MKKRVSLIMVFLVSIGLYAGCTDDSPATQSDAGTSHSDMGVSSDSFSGQSIEITDTQISGGAHWIGAIYILKNSLTIENGLLEVDACSKIVMPEGGKISVRDGGALRLIGTATCPITITSSKSSPQKGDWNYIEFYQSGDNGKNKFDYVIVEYGGGGSYGAIWLEDGASVAISNSTVQESKDYGIELSQDAHLKDFTNNKLINNALGPILLGANSVDDLGLGTYTPNTVEGIQIDNEYVDHDATWLALGVPYIAKSGFGLEVESGSAHLTVAADVTIKMGDGAKLSVLKNGGLTLAGTASAPVTITSAKAAPKAGDWNYIEIYSASASGFNVFDYAIIEYGGGGNYGAIWLEASAKLKMSNSTIRHSAHVGLQMEEGAHVTSFTGNTLTDNAKGPVELGADSVDDLGAGTYAPNTVEGIQVTNEEIKHEAKWLKLDTPYIAQNGFIVRTDSGSARLTVDPGVTIKLGSGAKIDIRQNGGLTLNGTSTSHVTITSAKAAPAPGDWHQIEIYGDSADPNNQFHYTDISYGGGSDYGQLWIEEGATVSLDHVTFSNKGKNCDVYAEEGSTINNLGGNTFVTCPH